MSSFFPEESENCDARFGQTFLQEITEATEVFGIPLLRFLCFLLLNLCLVDKTRSRVAENQGVVVLTRLVADQAGVDPVDGTKLVLAGVTNPGR